MWFSLKENSFDRLEGNDLTAGGLIYLLDTFLGDILFFPIFIVSLSIISYSLSFNNKFSKFGK